MPADDLADDVRKVRAYSRAVASIYIDADFKRALVGPAIDDQTVIDRCNESGAGRALDFLQILLYLDLIKDAVAITCDRDSRSASLYNLMRLLANDDLRATIQTDYCAPAWGGPPRDEAMKEVRAAVQAERRPRLESQFEDKYAALAKGVEEMLAEPETEKLRTARNKLIAHYEVTAAGEEPRLVRLADLDLNWGDAERLLDSAEPLVFETEMLVSGASYALDQFKRNHRGYAECFWATPDR